MAETTIEIDGLELPEVPRKNSLHPPLCENPCILKSYNKIIDETVCKNISCLMDKLAEFIEDIGTRFTKDSTFSAFIQATIEDIAYNGPNVQNGPFACLEAYLLSTEFKIIGNSSKMEDLTKIIQELLTESVEREQAGALNHILSKFTQWYAMEKFDPMRKKWKILRIDNEAMIRACEKDNIEMIHFFLVHEFDISYQFNKYETGTNDRMLSKRSLKEDELKKYKAFTAAAKPTFLIAKFMQSRNQSKSGCETDPISQAFLNCYDARKKKWDIPEYQAKFDVIEEESKKFILDMVKLCDDFDQTRLFLSYSINDYIDRKYDDKMVYKRMVWALLDQHLEFVAYDDCQYLVREAWLKCDITGRVMPWSSAGIIERVLYIILSAILLPIRIPLFIIFATYYQYRKVGQYNIDEIEMSPWKVTFFLFFYVPFNRFISHVMMHFFFMALVIVAIFNPEDEDDKLDVDWYDVLVLILSIAYVFMDIEKICKYKKMKNVNYVWVYNLFFHGSILLGIILKGVGYFHECGYKIQGCKFHSPEQLHSGKSPVVYGYCIYALGAVLGCLKMLHWTHMSHTVGPVVVCVTRTVKDIFSMVPIFIILYISFTLGIYYIMELVQNERCLNEHDGVYNRDLETWKIDEDINQWHTFISPADPNDPNSTSKDAFFPGRNAAKYSLWSLFDPGHTEGFGCTKGVPVYVATTLWWIYQVVIVLICMNLVIASMNATIQEVQEYSHEQWKFARTEIWIEFFDKRNVLPVPFNVGESIFYLVYDNWKQEDEPSIGQQSECLKDRYNKMVESLCNSYINQQEDSDTNKITKEDLENSKKGIIKELERSSLEVRG